jgi:hypothetical protein
MATNPTPSETGEQQETGRFPDFSARLAACRLDPRARDQLLCELLIAYRIARNRSQVAPLILEVVRPQLEVRRRRLSPQEPYLEAEDIAQQLAHEVLDLALRLPLQHGTFLERRLLLRAIERVTRGLRREVRYRNLVSYYPEEPGGEEAP